MSLVAIVVVVGPAAVVVLAILMTFSLSLISSVMVNIAIASVLAVLIELTSELIRVIESVPVLTILRAFEGRLHIGIKIRIEIVDMIIEVLAMVRRNIFPRLSQIIDSRIPNVLIVVPFSPLNAPLGIRVLIRIHLISHWFLRPK